MLHSLLTLLIAIALMVVLLTVCAVVVRIWEIGWEWVTGVVRSVYDNITSSLVLHYPNRRD